MQYRFNCCTLDKQRCGFNVPILQAFRKLLNKFMLIVKHMSNLTSYSLLINIKWGLPRLWSNMEYPHLARESGCQFNGPFDYG